MHRRVKSDDHGEGLRDAWDRTNDVPIQVAGRGLAQWRDLFQPAFVVVVPIDGVLPVSVREFLKLVTETGRPSRGRDLGASQWTRKPQQPPHCTNFGPRLSNVDEDTTGGAQLLDLDAGGVVEVVDEAGARLTIRLSARALDVAAVVAAFRGPHR